MVGVKGLNSVHWDRAADVVVFQSDTLWTRCTSRGRRIPWRLIPASSCRSSFARVRYCTTALRITPQVSLSSHSARSLSASFCYTPCLKKVAHHYHTLRNIFAHGLNWQLCVHKNCTYFGLWSSCCLLLNGIGKQFFLLNVYRTKVDNVVDLKQRIVAEWAALDHGIIASAIAQWRLRLHACVRAAGGHLEHCLQWHYLLFM